MPPTPDRHVFLSKDDVQKYASVFPEIFPELLCMAKEDQAHLHAMERDESRLKSRGQLFGFIVALAFLAAATILILENHDTAGTIVGSTDLVALVTVFVLGRRSASDSKSDRLAGGEDLPSARSAVGTGDQRAAQSSSQNQSNLTSPAHQALDALTDPATPSDEPSDVSAAKLVMSEDDRRLWERLSRDLGLSKDKDDWPTV